MSHNCAIRRRTDHASEDQDSGGENILPPTTTVSGAEAGSRDKLSGVVPRSP
jgi:hypothetical protein